MSRNEIDDKYRYIFSVALDFEYKEQNVVVSAVPGKATLVTRWVNIVICFPGTLVLTSTRTRISSRGPGELHSACVRYLFTVAG